MVLFFIVSISLFSASRSPWIFSKEIAGVSKTLRNVGISAGASDLCFWCVKFYQKSNLCASGLFPGKSLFYVCVRVRCCIRANEFFLFDNAERKRARSKWHRTTFAEWNRTVGPALVASPSWTSVLVTRYDAEPMQTQRLGISACSTPTPGTGRSASLA